VSDLSNSVADEEPSVTATSTSGEESAMTLSSILSLLTETEGVLTDVERALERLESGEYTTCEVCGEPIPEAILSQLPLARRCGAHEG
jgi:RNA polymerase-binding transcription factor DksA